MAAPAVTLESLNPKIVHVGQFDYSSIFRERRLRREQFEAWSRQPSFANVLPHWGPDDEIVSGGPFKSEQLAIDEASYRRYGFEPESAAVIAEFAGPSSELMPRAVLRQQIARAQDLGFDIRAAFEFEFIVLNETAASLRDRSFASPKQFAPANKCWDGSTAAEHAEFVSDLEAMSLATDVSLFAIAGELGPGCFEATLGAVDALRAADDASFFRLVSHAFARQRDLTITFMPSLGPSYPGLGGHVNFSIRDRKDGRNLLISDDGSTNDFAKSLIAGIIDLTPSAFAMCAQSVNAYRRYAPGTWAPKTVTWSEWTYTTAIRSAPSSLDTSRLEFRLPGADCNPYLTMALVIAGCLNGIERKLEAPEPIVGTGPDDIPAGATRLPRSLDESADVLANGSECRAIFGDRWVDHFSNICRTEYARLARSVSSDEVARYIEL